MGKGERIIFGTSEVRMYSLRLPVEVVERVDAIVAEMDDLSRSDWFRLAILEKLKREKICLKPKS